MKKLFYFLIVFSILNQAWAGPPQVNKNVLFLAHFDKKIDADFAKGNPKAYIHQAKLTKGRWGKGLDCHTGSYASFEAKGNIYAKEGTITFLVKPLWDKKDQNSHTFLSLRWNYPPGAYLVITKGWWEPEGKDWFYFIFNNQLYLADRVKTISEKARKIKPNIIISVDGHPAPKGYQPNIQGRDEITWANKGWIDIVFAMDYGRHIKYERWDKVRKELKKPSALIVLCGNYERTKDKKVVSREADLVATHIAYCQRKWPGNGVALYLQSMLSDEQIKALKLGPFKESALPFWK